MVKIPPFYFFYSLLFQLSSVDMYISTFCFHTFLPLSLEKFRMISPTRL